MRSKKRYALNVLGPFYVEDDCCMRCGVPQSIAPALFTENDQDHCYVRRQPESDGETDDMLRVMATQEVGCIRYGGSDPAILRRLVEIGEGDQCDLPPPRGAAPIRRDHVVFVGKPRTIPWTAREILERLVAFNSRWRSTSIHAPSDVSASVSVAWYEDNYYRIDAMASNEDSGWLIRHRGPLRLADSIHDWLVQEPSFESVRWQSREQFLENGTWTAKPW